MIFLTLKGNLWVFLTCWIAFTAGLAMGIFFLEPRPEPDPMTAAGLQTLSADEVWERDGDDLCISGAVVQDVNCELGITTTDVGYVHLNDDDILKIRPGDTIRFSGELHCSKQWEYFSFRNAELLDVRISEEEDDALENYPR